ncbi:hypothetical protein N177_1642 [Lutibaculum baratangense AMV1]|uniref:Uncharacterized protein n=1 Tax=Lutibaculum baratangense AMV1 TaxID=631454 RepID=V4RQW3_9HYPH|nr:hypothetical protein N177_1642 [Lutibaculum baratangense AMV1]
MDILDTHPSEEFDALCRAVARVMEMPIARVALIDEDRQWLKAAHGTPRVEAPRAFTFCNHTIEQDDVLVVEDAEADARFAAAVRSGAHAGIRFYAGAPILLAGRHPVGALCVMDSTPRTLGARETEVLKEFAAVAAGLIEGHAHARQARRDRCKLSRQVGKLMRQERDLDRRDRMLLQTERMAQIGGWEWDVERRRIHLSVGMYRLLGRTGRTRREVNEVMRFFPPESARAVHAAVYQARTTGAPFDIEIEFRSVAGEMRWARIVGEVERHEGAARRVFGSFQDVTEHRRLHERLWQTANCDDLTGLAKRARFTQTFEEALVAARSAGEQVGLLVIDLDHFKHVNDTLGHRAGDVMLMVTADRLRGSVGPEDCVARLGGDEFAVMVRRAAGAEALLDLGRLVSERLAEPIDYETETLSPGGSVGCALAPLHGASADTLMQNADMALYRAKSSGRGGAAIFEPRMRRAVQVRAEQITTFRDALKTGRVVPFYQPQMRLSDGRVCGFEALARWRMPDDRIATPQAFRHALEDGDVCTRLGLAMLEQVAADARRWIREGLDPGRISVNATSAELMRPDYCDRVRQILDRHGLDGSLLTVEVTETVFLGSGAGRVEQSLLALREMGASIALDDFGTGFASLTHLKTCPVDTIKIDRSFIAGLGKRADDQAIVAAIMHLARSLGIETVAEGVERREQLAFLRMMSCDKMQGFLLSAAVPADEVPLFLEARYSALTA